jgi:hypothetical protein
MPLIGKQLEILKPLHVSVTSCLRKILISERKLSVHIRNLAPPHLNPPPTLHQLD